MPIQGLLSFEEEGAAMGAASPGSITEMVGLYYESLYRYAFRLSGSAAEADKRPMHPRADLLLRLPSSLLPTDCRRNKKGRITPPVYPLNCGKISARSTAVQRAHERAGSGAAAGVRAAVVRSIGNPASSGAPLLGISMGGFAFSPSNSQLPFDQR